MTMIALMPSDSTRRSPAPVRTDAEDSALQPAVGIRRLFETGRARNALAIAACALLVPLFDLGGRAITLFVTRCFAATGPVAIAADVAVSLSLLAVALWMYVRYLRVSIEHLTKAIELHSASDEHAPLPERGPSAVLRLTRAIDFTRGRHAARLAELLDSQAAYAHDLQVPLERMGVRCETLDDLALRRSLTHDLAEMKQLVEASMACARMQCNVDEPPTHVSVDALLTGLIDDYRDAGHCIELESEVGYSIETCPHALRRVLVNLIDNALRYGSDVRLRLRVEAQAVVFAVLDNGPGIEPSQMEAVFAPWYRAPRTAARAPGSGLGLAIARRLTHAMHGELCLENRLTGGLEARLTLPLIVA
ncbi:ATP-binding protein [Paraburkholderia caledonica]|uniref:ATP-binding protein n=1 Tax=Paraburkholderia caledonica TaxID=134536 RepID=UPI000DEF335F|nr:ATP-binding protein [Paraburkholderia caledonica]AXF14887.1 histidine kinase [Paraburkholderia caledonica]